MTSPTARTKPTKPQVRETTVRELTLDVPHWLGPDYPGEHLSLTAWGNGEGWAISHLSGSAEQHLSLSRDALDGLVKLWRAAKR